ncbi:MAG TPA: response regulator, partial [Polyangiaceae bacterium]|nr:response regulator [Polyangiaceae bacterium]
MTNVLVFESDPGFAGALQTELEQRGCSVRVVDDGNEGLRLASSSRPDLILLSIELPRMNGFSVCNKLKKDPQTSGVPLIILSSDSTEDVFDQHRKLRTRAEAYFRKPIEFDALLPHIESLVT